MMRQRSFQPGLAGVFGLIAAAMLFLDPAPALAQQDNRLQAEVGELRKRVEQLEGQLVDLQVVIGTLESLARNPASAGSAGSAGADTARVAALETQVSALAAQVAQLSQKLQTGAPVGRAPAQQRGDAGPSFGSTTVTERKASQFSADTQRAELAPVPGGQANAGGDPKADFERAYGDLLQRNYDAARRGFQSFLRSYPRHELAGNAQYWLGEVYFVRGDYKRAAQAFLAGYQKFGRGSKAPDSLLKLAVSLNRLGQKDAACQSFGELLTRFPNAQDYIRRRAQQERRQIGCSAG